MPKIRVGGVKSYRSKGRIYHYHRSTGIRIEFDISVEPEKFLARVRELDRAALPIPLAPPPAPDITGDDPVNTKTLNSLFDAWQQSQEWQALRPQTQITYLRIIDRSTGALRDALALPVHALTPSKIVQLRDSVTKAKKRWLGTGLTQIEAIALNSLQSPHVLNMFLEGFEPYKSQSWPINSSSRRKQARRKTSALLWVLGTVISSQQRDT